MTQLTAEDKTFIQTGSTMAVAAKETQNNSSAATIRL